jgi:hypothetical protein
LMMMDDDWCKEHLKETVFFFQTTYWGFLLIFHHFQETRRLWFTL